MEGTAGSDLRHIQKHYADFFKSLTIEGESDGVAEFSVAALTAPDAPVKVRLGSNGFQVIGTGDVYESFEALISSFMGPRAFGQLLSRLVNDKFREPYCCILLLSVSVYASPRDCLVCYLV
jgi:hypothetical protein